MTVYQVTKKSEDDADENRDDQSGDYWNGCSFNDCEG
jgi:hypothetical protein